MLRRRALFLAGLPLGAHAQKLRVSAPQRQIRIGLFIIHLNGIRRVQADDAVVFDIDAGDAVAGGGHDEVRGEADVHGAGGHFTVPVHLGFTAAKAEVPLAHDRGLVADLLEDGGDGLAAGFDDELRIAGKDAGAFLAEGVFSGEQ